MQNSKVRRGAARCVGRSEALEASEQLRPLEADAGRRCCGRTRCAEAVFAADAAAGDRKRYRERHRGPVEDGGRERHRRTGGPREARGARTAPGDSGEIPEVIQHPGFAESCDAQHLGGRSARRADVVQILADDLREPRGSARVEALVLHVRERCIPKVLGGGRRGLGRAIRNGAVGLAGLNLGQD